ncbi:MAG: cell surface protein, partial [Pseudomonadota bacterium]
DNITIGYNTSDVIMARLVQTTNAKERIYAQSVSFFSTNEIVLTALTASFTGLHGLHESTETLNAMKEGVNKSLEVLAEIGNEVQEAATRAGYGPTVSAASVKVLVDAVVTYQERTQAIIEEMRVKASQNSEEIRDAVEDGKRRMTALVEQGAAAALLPKG